MTRAFLAGLFMGGTLAVAAYIELSARRGVPAGPTWDEADEMCPNCVTPWKCNGPHLGPRYTSDVVYGPQPIPGTNPVAYWSLPVIDDWATDPRTAELATGGGQEGAEQ